MASNVQRTLEILRGAPYNFEFIGRVERFDGMPGRKCPDCKKWILGWGQKNDLFGVYDYLGIDDVPMTWGIQICGADFAQHVATIEGANVFNPWIWSGNGILLIGWRKVVYKRGGKAMRWRPRTRIWTPALHGEPTHVEDDDGITRDDTGRLID